MKMSAAMLARSPWLKRLPEGWNVVPLSSLVDPRRPICYGVVQPGEAEPGGVLMIRSGDVHEGEISSELRTIPKRIAKAYRRSSLNGGEVVVSLVGEPGQAARVPEHLAGANIARQVGLVAIPDSEMAAYVEHYLNSDVGRAVVLTPVVGSAQKVVNLADLKATPVPIPPRPELLQLVNTAEGFTLVSRSIEATIKAKREFKNGLAQLLLKGERRFPEFKRAAWHYSALANHVKAVTRKNTNGQTLVMTASGEHGLVDQKRYFNRNVAGADLSKYHLIKKKEFAYNRSAMNGYPYGATKRLDEHDEGALSTLYLCFGISDKKLDSDFLKHVFDSGVLDRQLRPIVRIGARAHGLLNVSDDDFLSMAIPFPELKEQRKISQILNDLNRELDLLVQQRKQVECYKHGTLSRLLSGEILVTA